MALPPPGPDQAYCDVSALEAGVLGLPLALFVTNSAPDVVDSVPSLSFLLQHSTDNHKFVFDLGVRKDWEKYPPSIVELLEQNVGLCTVHQDVVESLAKGGTAPSDISTVCLSHAHWDHVGDTTPFTKSTFLLGEGAELLLRNGYPSNPTSPFASDLLPPLRTKFLPPTGWQPLGPFPHTLDFYGDGSLYIVDAPGHLAGHITVLARTSSDGAWIYLAGDSAHHWDLITGKADIVVLPGHKFPCAHVDKEAAEKQILRIRELCKYPRARVLLAHDGPWYNINKGGPAFWPGKIPSL